MPALLEKLLVLALATLVAIVAVQVAGQFGWTDYVLIGSAGLMVVIVYHHITHRRGSPDETEGWLEKTLFVALAVMITIAAVNAGSDTTVGKLLHDFIARTFG